jgi:SRSO17 transposase
VGGPIEAWIIDDTGLPKKGKYAVGRARLYCGRLGRLHNCQPAVSLSLANRRSSLPVRYRLCLPPKGTNDAARRRKAHIPEEVVFKTKLEIALDLVRWAYEAELPRGVVLLDAGYGNHTNLRTQIRAGPYVCCRRSFDHGRVGARQYGAAA